MAGNVAKRTRSLTMIVEDLTDEVEVNDLD